MSLWKGPCQSCPPPQGLDSSGDTLMCLLLLLGLLGVEFSSWHQLCARWDLKCIYTDISRLHGEAGPRKLSSATDGAAVRSCWPWLEKLARSSCYHPKALQKVTCWYLFVCWFLCSLSSRVQPCRPSQRLIVVVTFLLVFHNFSADLKLANHVR